MTTAAPPLESSLAKLLADGLFVDGDWIESKDQDPVGDVRLIQLADIGDGVFRDRSSRYLTIQKAKELRCTFLEPRDVLIARMPEPLGRACVFPDLDQLAVTAVDVCIARPNPDRVLSEWLADAINSPDVRLSMQKHVRGTTRQRISRKNLGTLDLVVPGRDEQVAIARAVRQIQSKRSSASGHLSTAARAIHRFRQAVLAAASSGRLTADWRDQHEHTHGETAEALIERSRQLICARHASREQHEASAVPDWIDLPEAWCWSPLSSLAEIRGGIQKQPKRLPGNNAYPYLRVANVFRGRLDLSEIKEFELFGDELATYRLETGDLLVVEGNGSASQIGRSALWNGEIVDCVHQNHIIRVRCVAMDPYFVDVFWNSPVGSREVAALAVTSAGLYSLSTKKIGAVNVPVAPIEEQREIVRRVRGLLDLANRLDVRVEVAEHSVDRSSRAILTKAFRGELNLDSAMGSVRVSDSHAATDGEATG